MFLQSEDFNVAPTFKWRSSARSRHLAARHLIAWRAFRLLLHVCHGLLLAFFVLPFSSRQTIAQQTRRWSLRLLNILALRVNVHNIVALLPLPGQLIVSNHISWLDVFVLNSLLPARFVTKAEVKHWPLIGFMCQRAGCIFLARQRPRAIAAVKTQMCDLFAQGEIVALFPEGTTSRGNTLKPFKSALLQAAIDSGTAIVPITLRYRDIHDELSDAAAYVGEMNLLQSLVAIMSQRALQVDLTVLPAHRVAQRDRAELASELYHAIDNALF